jgi:uncharacterized integral membrane protein
MESDEVDSTDLDEVVDGSSGSVVESLAAGQPAQPLMSEGSQASTDRETTGASSEEAGTRRSGRVPISRSGVTWVVLFGGLVLLVVILIFILENLKAVNATFFSAHWRIPLGVDLLLAAVLGGLVVFLLGTVRILQLRRLASRRGRGQTSRARFGRFSIRRGTGDGSRVTEHG